MTTNRFYENSSTYTANTLIRATDVDADLNGIATGFDLVQSELDALAASSFTAATSTTSLAIEVASKTLTVTASDFARGQSVKIAYTTTPTNWMHGDVTSYNSTTGELIVNVTTISGSGTYAAWTITLSAPVLSRSDVQEFTANGTWTKPNGNYTLVELWGAGAGAGSGERNALASYRNGGGGGGGGAYRRWLFKTSDLGATETVTIGAGGTGGAAITTDTTAGNDGTNGGNTSFGSHLIAYGGGYGTGGGVGGAGGGTMGAASSATPGQPYIATTGVAAEAFGGGHPGAVSGSGLFTYGQPSGEGGGGGGANAAGEAIGSGGCSTYGGPGGGSGGGVSTANGESAGGAGGSSTGASGGGGVGGAEHTAAAATTGRKGGGGGGSGNSTTGGAGAAGGGYGAGGGGGGGSTNGYASGAGGNGANGFARITTW